MAKMKLILALTLFVAVAYAIQRDYKQDDGDLTYEQHFMKMIENANGFPTTWRLGFNAYFAGRKMSDIWSILGTRLDRKSNKPQVRRTVTKDLPDEFDGRKTWSFCRNISSIRDQAKCGSCWAESTTEVATDRTCIQTGGKKQPVISVEDLMTCCTECVPQSGCKGGYLDQAMDYWENTGIVTGGNYDSDRGCQPYEIAPGAPPVPTPACQKTCEPGYPIPYAKDKHHAKSSYAVTGSEAEIRQEIFENGPIAAGFSVYDDFFSYKTGVYQHQTGVLRGGHGVKILGWGTEDSTPYWLVANSWNTTWGDHGFFKILRGSDECGIESSLFAGLARD